MAKYGYNVTTSYSVYPPSVEMFVYRVSSKEGANGQAYLDKTNIARYEAPTDVRSNEYSGSHGISAVAANILLKDFLAANPDAKDHLNSRPTYKPGETLMTREVQAEIDVAHEEALAIEARRTDVALAVAGMDLATADKMAAVEASQLVESPAALTQE